MAKNAAIIVAVVAVVVVVAMVKSGREVVPDGPSSEPSPEDGAFLPRMIDLGADQCVACKQMAPILEQLRAEYEGRADIVFIDVRKNPTANALYGVRSIPTQIFFDRQGEEVWRHEGLLTKEAIVAKLGELGVK